VQIFYWLLIKLIVIFLKQTGVTFLLPAYPRCPGKEAVKRCDSRMIIKTFGENCLDGVNTFNVVHVPWQCNGLAEDCWQISFVSLNTITCWRGHNSSYLWPCLCASALLGCTFVFDLCPFLWILGWIWLTMVCLENGHSGGDWSSGQIFYGNGDDENMMTHLRILQ